MFYCIYEIKNTANGKIYIGAHATSNLEDDYMGSGKILLFAIEKHGIDNFSKTILEILPTKEDMFRRESEIVNEDFIKRKDVYNLKVGGHGGWDFVNTDEEIRKNRSERTKGSGNSFFGKTHTLETKQKIAESTSKQWLGVSKTEDHKANIAKALKGVPLTEERKKNISAAKKAKNRPSWSKGMKLPRIKCPHCDVTGDKSNMKRWHFDNCKNKDKSCIAE